MSQTEVKKEAKPRAGSKTWVMGLIIFLSSLVAQLLGVDIDPASVAEQLLGLDWGAEIWGMVVGALFIALREMTGLPLSGLLNSKK